MRPGERRDAWAAFLTLFCLIASHAVLETARDALFLAKVPATQLPWVFLAVAALSFAFVRLQSRVGRTLTERSALVVWTLATALVTFAFFRLFDILGRAGVYALYVWSGVLTTLLLVRFWTLVGNLFTVTQAKRLYGFVGAGSVLGAIAGSGAAGALSRIVAPQRLLAVSAAASW
jgi:AAA family ATP:ADP antiporter